MDRTLILVLIDSRVLERECFVQTICRARDEISIETFSSSQAYISSRARIHPPTAILFNTEGKSVDEPDVRASIALLRAHCGATPIIVLSPIEELGEVLSALDCGATGYIPVSLGIEATITAMKLTAVGGIYLPTESVRRFCRPRAAHPNRQLMAKFTPRQASVAEALRRGKPNKIIAYELKMCESTVNIHIRNIMKKLDAKNRTEAGFKLNSSGGVGDDDTVETRANAFAG